MKQMDSLIKNSVNKKSFIKGPKGSLTLKLANGVWRKRFPSRLAAGIFLANSIVPIAMAGPTGGTVVGGQGNINYGVNTTQINQNSNNLVIDWTSFDVNTNESVIFNQPTSQSIAVNNVLNNQASTISGSIQANGYVVLVNSSGVIFTESSTVDVGGLVVSGLAINTDAFLNGEFDFKAVENGDGFVVTSGVINAASGIVLLGESVENTGTLISAGVVNLTAADEVLLTFDEGGVIGLKVKEELLTNDLGVDAAVLNTGKIEAGSVVLDGRVSADLFARAVNNEGIIKAGGIDTSGGKIRLTGIGSDVINTGTLDASSLAHEGGSIHVEGNRAIVDGIIDVSSVEASGGQVRILGDAVGLVGNANINASGATGGGEVLVGGDYQGANPNIRNAEVTYIGSDTEINASAIESGDGGRVIVWANDTTRFYGDIKAEGGNEIGDGGFVETSGKRYVDLRGQVSARAENGTAGQWLIDPTNIEIVAFDDGRDPVPSTDDGMGSVVFTPGVTDSNSIVVASNITDALNGGSSVEITTNNSSNGPDNGDITVSTDLLVDPTNDVTLTLTADNNINVNADIQATGSNTGSLNVTLTAGLSEVNSGVVNLGSDSTTTSIVTRGGNVTVNAGSDDGMGGFTDGSVTLFAGSEIITEGGDNVVDINGEFVPVAGSVEIIASGDIGIIGTINTSGVVGDVGNAEARITGGVGQNAGDISLTSNTGDVNVTGSLMANGGAGGLGANGVIGNGSNRRPPTAGGVGGTGGNITLLGNNIFVDSTALISATGGSGGNGGDARDSNGAVDDGASGGVGGDGGVVDIQASGGLVVNVNIVAAGGRGGDGGNATVGAGSGAVAGASGNGGNGGAISIIASGELSISQELNTSFGTPGTPGDRDADVGNDDGVEVGVLGDFGSGGNIQISSDGVITLEDGSMVNTGGGTFTINSLNDTTNSLIAAGGINSVGGGVTFNIADTVELRGASNGGSFSLETGGGAFTINSNSSFTSSGSIVTESGNVNITAVGAVDIQGNINSSALVNNVNGGDVSITSGTSSITLGTELVPLDITSSAFGGSGSGGSITFNSRNSIVVRNSRITSRSDAVGTDSTPLASNNDINFNVTGDLVSSGLDIDSSVTLDSDIINASVGRGDDLMSTMDDIASVVAFGVILNERTGDLISIETSSLDDLVTVGGDLFSFSGATTTIDLGVGDDALDASSNDLNISAVGEVSLVSTGSGTVTLLGVEAFDNIGTLLGSDTDESFVLTGTTVTVDTVLDTSFTNVSVIDAGNGTDTVDINTDNASLGVSGFTTDSGV
ncbi:beta strand repeat-containing protein, partial [Sessilibacter sp. MAH2]